MSITLKNVKHSEFASQETHCFEATVYIDGKRAFIASNEGRGGSNSYYPVKGGTTNVNKKVSAVDAELKTETITTEYGELDNCLEIVIGHLINDWLAISEAKKLLRKVCIVDDGKILQFSVSGAQFKRHPEGITASILRSHPDAVVLNALDVSEAVRLIKAAA